MNELQNICKISILQQHVVYLIVKLLVCRISLLLYAKVKLSSKIRFGTIWVDLKVTNIISINFI